MLSENKRKNLGRGLDALLGEENIVNPVSLDGSSSQARFSALYLPLESLIPGKYQPRVRFNETELRGLADSIKASGILQPILVRVHPTIDNKWEIIAGERRWRAAQIAQIHEVPVFVRELTDEKVLEVALIENLQRENLTPIEEAQGYQKLIREFFYTPKALGKVIGKSRSHVANAIRLLSLPDKVKNLLESGALSAGHARALLTVDSPAELAKVVVKKGLSVRQTEKLAQKVSSKKRRKHSKAEKDSDTLALEKDLSFSLGLSVSIDFDDPGGKLTINYNTLDQLDYVIGRLKQNQIINSSDTNLSKAAVDD